nr:ACT domain-containing protein [Kineosphaera limosa]
MVLTVIGDDRAGLVSALSEAVAAAGGNWEQSHLAELAGKFAGIILVTAPADKAGAVADRLRAVDGALEVVVQEGEVQDVGAQPSVGRELVVELVGNDSPGIVREISGVLHRHDVSIGGMTSDTRDAPMSGGRLFEARITAVVPDQLDTADLRADLEKLAGELLVDLELADA